MSERPDVSKASPGQALYERWCGSEISDSARYFELMNPVDREAWDRIGTEVRALLLFSVDMLAYSSSTSDADGAEYVRRRLREVVDIYAKGDIPEANWR